MKFKIGDKVKLTRIPEEGEYFSGIFCPEMKVVIGEVGEVIHISPALSDRIYVDFPSLSHYVWDINFLQIASKKKKIG